MRVNGEIFRQVSCWPRAGKENNIRKSAKVVVIEVYACHEGGSLAEILQQVVGREINFSSRVLAKKISAVAALADAPQNAFIYKRQALI